MPNVFVAYESADPWASRMIDVDQDFERLCQRLESRLSPVTPFGPVIFRCDSDRDPQIHGFPIAKWCGGGQVSRIGKSEGLMSSVADFVLEVLDE